MPMAGSGWWRTTASYVPDVSNPLRRRGDAREEFAMQSTKSLLVALGFAMLTTAARAADMAPIKPVAHVDLARFMGSWYVIAGIPSILEKNAYNAVETYQLQPSGHIATSFRYRNKSFGNPVKTIHSTGFVTPNTGNAVWGIQLVWPIKAQYLVAYLADDYSE